MLLLRCSVCSGLFANAEKNSSFFQNQFSSDKNLNAPRYRRFCENGGDRFDKVQVQILPLPLQLRDITARGEIFKRSNGWEKATS